MSIGILQEQPEKNPTRLHLLKDAMLICLVREANSDRKC